MSYFISEQPLETGNILELTGDEARHILLSRRIKIGEKIEIQDPDSKRFKAEIALINKKNVSVKVLEKLETPVEPELKITIFQSLIAEQPLDFIIQKATELGVEKLVIFKSQNSVPSPKEVGKKLARWQKIGWEAAKQSGRVKPVSIESLADAKDIFEVAKDFAQIFLLEPGAKNNFRDLPRTWELSSQIKKIGILVGPEGGFTKDEVREFSKMENVAAVGMGLRILRAETAAIAATAIIQALWGDM